MFEPKNEKIAELPTAKYPSYLFQFSRAEEASSPRCSCLDAASDWPVSTQVCIPGRCFLAKMRPNYVNRIASSLVIQWLS